jgi:hypothetical protein
VICITHVPSSAVFQVIAADNTLIVELSHDEALLLKNVAGKDQFLRRLTETQKGLSALNAMISEATGPVSLAFQ